MDYLNFVFDLRMLYWLWIDCRIYYYVDRSKSRLIVQWWLKIETFLEYIEAFVDFWGQSFVGNMDTGGQAAAEQVVRIFEVS